MGDRALQRPWRRPCAPLGISKPALTWVVPAAGRHRHCERLWLSSGPGSHPDRGLGGVLWTLGGGRGWLLQLTQGHSLYVHPEACASATCMLLSLSVVQAQVRHHPGQKIASRSSRSAPVSEPGGRADRGLTGALALICTLFSWSLWHPWSL